MPTKTRILARLFKTPSHRGSYLLRGRLPDGRLVEVFCNQGKSGPEDPDFLLVEVAEEATQRHVAGSRRPTNMTSAPGRLTGAS